jgi:hypothetical protein
MELTVEKMLYDSLKGQSDSREQVYALDNQGAIVRVNSAGEIIPRIRMSKKKKLKLRKELHKISSMGSHELSCRIIHESSEVQKVDSNE